MLDPLVFLERLAALVPPPRAHQQTYHGVLAPSSSWRDDVVIAGPASRRAADAPRGRPTATSGPS